MLLVGGLFLIAKSTHELLRTRRGEAADDETAAPAAAEPAAGFASTLVQILALDIVFSLDSVITAVGMARADHRS